MNHNITIILVMVSHCFQKPLSQNEEARDVRNEKTGSPSLGELPQNATRKQHFPNSKMNQLQVLRHFIFNDVHNDKSMLF